MNKKQNKEQVPPPAEPQPKKPAPKPKPPAPVPASTQHKTVEEAFKAVSNTYR